MNKQELSKKVKSVLENKVFQDENDIFYLVDDVLPKKSTVGLFCEYWETGRSFTASDLVYLEVDLNHEIDDDREDYHLSILIGRLERSYNASFSFPDRAGEKIIC